MNTSSAQSRNTPIREDDESEIVLNVLAAEQADRRHAGIERISVRKVARPTFDAPSKVQRSISSPSLAKAANVIPIAHGEPMCAVIDKVRIQRHKMYRHRRMAHLWPRAVISILLVAILGCTLYALLLKNTLLNPFQW